MNDIIKIKNEIEACNEALNQAWNEHWKMDLKYTDDGVCYGGNVSLIEKLHAKLDRLYRNLGHAEALI
jgi:hypothetical protein